jgi:hypothetical protein
VGKGGSNILKVGSNLPTHSDEPVDETLIKIMQGVTRVAMPKMELLDVHIPGPNGGGKSALRLEVAVLHRSSSIME